MLRTAFFSLLHHYGAKKSYRMARPDLITRKPRPDHSFHLLYKQELLFGLGLLVALSRRQVLMQKLLLNPILLVILMSLATISVNASEKNIEDDAQSPAPAQIADPKKIDVVVNVDAFAERSSSTRVRGTSVYADSDGLYLGLNYAGFRSRLTGRTSSGFYFFLGLEIPSSISPYAEAGIDVGQRAYKRFLDLDGGDNIYYRVGIRTRLPHQVVAGAYLGMYRFNFDQMDLDRRVIRVTGVNVGMRF